MTKFPNTFLDHAIGSVLSIASSLGIAANILSLCYFLSMKRRNLNNEFFKILYSIISLNDILLCISVIPVIEAAFSEDRGGKMFNNHDFCTIWYVFQFITFEMSVILLTILSLSRFVLIKNPKVIYYPCSAYIIAGLFLAGYLTLFIGSITSDLIEISYLAEFMQCRWLAKNVATNSSILMYSPKDQAIARVFLTADCGITSLCYLTVCISVVASLVYLAKSKKAVVTSSHQTRAASTVIYMTALFIVSNTLTVMMYCSFISEWSILNPVEMGTTTVSQVLMRYSTDIFKDSRFLSQYGSVIATTFGACLNSSMNPAVYYFRLQAYQRFVHQLMGSLQTRLRRPYSIVTVVGSN